MSALDLVDVYKAFGRTAVLQGVSLHVAEGSCLAVLGSSGSGKTTLLRVVAGFETIDGGSVSVDDQPVATPDLHVAPERRGVAIVPQEHALFPHLTVAANIGFGVPRRERPGRVAEMSRLVGLDGLESRYPSELSGGQQQRVALARALAVRPAALLLDEPFSGLDAGLRASMREEVSQLLRRAGTTTVLVTHDQEEALSIADRVAVLRRGVVVQSATPSDLYARPADLDVARFVGEANLLAGTVAGKVLTCVLGTFALTQSVPDGPVTALVRPEQIDLVHLDEGSPGRASEPFEAGRSISGIVVDRQYYGHDAVVLVALVDGQQLHVRVRGGAPVRNTGVALGLSPGIEPICYPVSPVSSS